MAVDKSWQYRPHEIPGNQHFAGDADGTSRASVARRTYLLIRRLPPPIPESSLKTALKAVVADEQLLDDPRA
jgi:hypothetical protein